MEKKEFKRLFPHIAEEMEKGTSKVDIKAIEETPPPSTKPSYQDERGYAGYQPSTIDFLRRCKTQNQAEEIIAYLEKKGEVQSEEADSLRKQLREQGLRSFGTRKTIGYYEK
jgi:hypothetical protein